MAVRRKPYDDAAIREQFTQPVGEPVPLPEPANPMPAQEAISRATDPGNARVSSTGIADPRAQVAGAYKQYLGREGSEEEIGSHLGQGANVAQSLKNISGSEEARNYAKRPTATPSTPSNAAAGVGSSAAGGGPSGAIPGQAGYHTGGPGWSGTEPNIGQEAATVSEAQPGADNSGGMASGYDYIPGAEDVQWGDTSRLSGFNTNEWGAGGSEGYDEVQLQEHVREDCQPLRAQPRERPADIQRPGLPEDVSERRADRSSNRPQDQV